MWSSVTNLFSRWVEKCVCQILWIDSSSSKITICVLGEKVILLWNQSGSLVIGSLIVKVVPSPSFD